MPQAKFNGVLTVSVGDTGENLFMPMDSVVVTSADLEAFKQNPTAGKLEINFYITPNGEIRAQAVVPTTGFPPPPPPNLPPQPPFQPPVND